ncbi:DUF2911 domain-containing protein [Tenacibaculum agarivorans]|uniref:DUF2911 domain-containing protein n=1 Tax=Tenacibaculum agarivorans TaxID=1908389 RepID=UPI00094B8B75|nr:DUF2911 domain-containing protein [Tenacibaculum agarivorans]
MKKYITILIFSINTLVFGQLKTPDLSPNAKVSQKIGLSMVEIEYSRPSKRGREIFGDLLSYNQPWRVGANRATKVSLSKPVTINGKQFEKGEYSIIGFPNQDYWEIKWYSYSSTNWNVYKKETPIVSMKIETVNLPSEVETLEIRFQNTTLHSADIFIEWDKTRIVLPVKVNEKEEIIQSIDKALAGPSDLDYFKSALYYHETKTDLDKALACIQKVTQSEKALFFQVTREALILKDLKRNNEAISVAKKALKLSEKAKNVDFIKINTKIINELK